MKFLLHPVRLIDTTEHVDKMRGGGGQKMTATRIPTEKRGLIFFIFMIDICSLNPPINSLTDFNQFSNRPHNPVTL